jgi:hypothetical protein
VSAIYDSLNYDNMNICQRLHYTRRDMPLFFLSGSTMPNLQLNNRTYHLVLMAKISKDSNTKATVRNVRKLILPVFLGIAFLLLSSVN